MKIETEGVSVHYRATRALNAIDIAAHPGEVLGLIGPNGSGKSTLVKAIAGIAAATGRVLFGGEPRRPEVLGYMPQDIGARTALTVLEVVLLGRLGRLGLRVDQHDLAAVGATLEELGLSRLASRFIGELSGGQRQLVYLAQALAAEPPVLLLDEPVSALDIRHQLEVLEIIGRLTRERGLTTIAILHDLNATARHADRVALLKSGDLIGHGRPADILTAPLIARAFEVEAAVSTGADGHPIITPLRALGRKAA